MEYFSRSAKDVNSQYKALEARLSKEEAERGDPVEIAQKYKEVQQRYSGIIKALEGHSNLLEVCMFSTEKDGKEYIIYIYIFIMVVLTFYIFSKGSEVSLLPNSLYSRVSRKDNKNMDVSGDLHP